MSADGESRAHPYDVPVTILTEVEVIRRHPAMYVGETGPRGLHYLLWELLSNSTEEIVENCGNTITIELTSDHGCRLSDNGSGLPLCPVPPHEMEPSFRWACSYARPRDKPYCTSVLRGAGLLAVNALSRDFLIEVSRDGLLHRQRFQRGECQGSVEVVGESRSTGTSITFWPDPDTFDVCEFDPDTIRQKCEEWAYLHPFLTIHFQGEVFHSPEGTTSFVRKLNVDRVKIHPHLFTLQVEDEENQLEIAFQWTETETAEIRPYLNGLLSHCEGRHVTGFTRALRATLDSLSDDGELIPGHSNQFEPEECLEGLTAIIHLRNQRVWDESNTPRRVNHEEVEWLVRAQVEPALALFLREHSEDAKAIYQRVKLAQLARLQRALVKRAKRPCRVNETGRKPN